MLPWSVHSEQTQPVQDSSTALQSTDRAGASYGLLHQLCCGYAVFLPFVLLSVSAVPSAVIPIYAALMSAGVLIAFGAGYPLHAWISRKSGLHVATRISLLSTATGTMVATIGSLPWITLCGCFLIGFGLFGEWTPSAAVTRGSLSSTQLWRGMRLHSALLFVGALLAVTVVQADAGVVFLSMSVVIAFICVVVAMFVQPIQDGRFQPDETDASGQTDSSRSDPVDTESRAAAEPSSSQPPLDCGGGEPESCEAEICCGGGRPWTPMPGWLGGCMAFAGLYAVGAVLTGLISSVNQWSAVLVLTGGLLGTVLFQAVIPTTGYAVLLVPVCIAGAVVFGISPWLPAGWSNVVLTGKGVIAAAIWSGCSGLVGESFADSIQRNRRTAVLAVGSLAAAAVALVTGMLAMVLSPTVGTVIQALVCVMTILWLRNIPSVLVSQRREDEMSSEEAEQVLSESMGVAGGPLG
jgi:hypothetical protein